MHQRRPGRPGRRRHLCLLTSKYKKYTISEVTPPISFDLLKLIALNYETLTVCIDVLVHLVVVFGIIVMCYDCLWVTTKSTNRPSMGNVKMKNKKTLHQRHRVVVGGSHHISSTHTILSLFYTWFGLAELTRSNTMRHYIASGTTTAQQLVVSLRQLR